MADIDAHVDKLVKLATAESQTTGGSTDRTELKEKLRELVIEDRQSTLSKYAETKGNESARATQAACSLQTPRAMEVSNSSALAFSTLCISPDSPAKFTGSTMSQDAVDAFIDGMDSMFFFEPRLTEIQKVVFATTKFQPDCPAATWIRPLLRQLKDNDPDAPVWLQSWQSFAHMLRSKFGDLNDLESVVARFRVLKQTGSARDYSTAFGALAERLKMSEELKVIFYRQHLKLEIQNSISGRSFSTFNEISTVTVQIDGDLARQRRAQANTDTYGAPLAYSAPATDTNRVPLGGRDPYWDSNNHLAGSEPAPMEVDAIRSGPCGSLTEDEMKRRVILGLCHFCAEKGHLARNCPRTGLGRARFTAHNQGHHAFTEASTSNEAK